MLSMPFADSSSLSSPGAGRARPRVAAGLLALIVAAVTPAIALADTGGPYPQGYTPDVAQTPPPPTEADPADEYADTDPNALTDFRQPLDPHGSWVQDPTYGTIWVPNAAEVGADFAPYQTAGQWGVDNSGEWMWQSDYSWGYIPFHYGRWVWAGSNWGWIAGRTYAPAWVTWRVGEGGYLGWAPLPPTWYWANGYATGLWTVPYAAYCFVPTGYAFHSNVSSYVVRDRGTVQTAAAGTRPYHPATPGVGHNSPVGSHAPQHAGGTMSPSVSEAHIPASAVPQAHAVADARATAYATRSSTAALHGNNAASQGRTTLSNVSPRQGGNAWHNSYDRAPAAQAGRAQSFQGSPQGGRATPSFHGSPGGSYRGSPSFEVTQPSYHGAPAYHSGGPAYHGAPAYHAPAHSSSSAPAARSGGRSSGGRSGGGFHGGGGRR